MASLFDPRNYPPRAFRSGLPPRPTPPAQPPIILWNGLSGRQFRFELYPIGTAFNDVPGVYIFCRQAPSGMWDAIYIGETVSLKARLTDTIVQHHQLASIRRAGATHVCVLVARGPIGYREGIETDLRRRIKTPCNQQ